MNHGIVNELTIQLVTHSSPSGANFLQFKGLKSFYHLRENLSSDSHKFPKLPETFEIKQQLNLLKDSFIMGLYILHVTLSLAVIRG